MRLPRIRRCRTTVAPLFLSLALSAAANAQAPLADYPSVKEVLKTVKGRNRADTAAKQSEVFYFLSWSIRATSQGGQFGSNWTAEEAALSSEYMRATAKRGEVGRRALGVSSPGTDRSSVNRRWAQLQARHKGDGESVVRRYWPKVTDAVRARQAADSGLFAGNTRATERWTEHLPDLPNIDLQDGLASLDAWTRDLAEDLPSQAEVEDVAVAFVKHPGVQRRMWPAGVLLALWLLLVAFRFRMRRRDREDASQNAQVVQKKEDIFAALKSGVERLPLQERVAQVVEGLARDLDAGELELGDPQSREFRVNLDREHRVQTNIAYTDGPGGVPSGVQSVRSESDLKDQLAQRQHLVESEAPELLDRWQRNHATRYDAAPKDTDCMVAHAPLAFAFNCKTCGGSGALRCSSCQGAGQTTCHHCGGSGRTRCTSCDGYGRRRCWSCSGQGSVDQQVDGSRYNPVTQRNEFTRETRRVSCSSCSGRGYSNCYSCTFGMVTCNYCTSGKVTCGTCSGSGKVGCPGCEGSGQNHRSGRITCQVVTSNDLGVGSKLPEDRHTLATLVPFRALGHIASLQLQNAERRDLTLRHRYTGTVPVETVGALAHRQPVSVSGYGPQARVFDWRHLIEKLLAEDLSELEQVTSTRFAGFRRVSPTEQIQRFLSSELHAAVADGDSVEATVERNLVSAEYIDRVRAAVTRAVPLLYGSFAVPMLLATLLIVGLAFAAVAFFGRELLPQMGLSEQALWVVLGGLLLWSFMELQMQARLRTRLGPALAARISDIRKKHQSRHRWVVRLAMVGGWVGVVWMSMRP